MISNEARLLMKPLRALQGCSEGVLAKEVEKKPEAFIGSVTLEAAN